MGHYFGTDGFRGEAGVKLTAEHAFRIGRFCGWKAKEGGGRILVGKDTRLSSDTLENALAAGITSSGSEACLLRVATTPCVGFLTRTERFDCGVMISASHNPFSDNGIKILNRESEKISEDAEAEIEALLDGSPAELPYASGKEIGKTAEYGEGITRYFSFLTSHAPTTLTGMRVALDCANGSAYRLGRRVFEALGAEVFTVGDNPNGVNINAACGSTHIETLQKCTAENRCDVGFAYDGDADRCIAVDEKGNAVNGDRLLYIAAKMLKEQNRLPGGKIAATVMSNRGLETSLAEEGIGVLRTPVGDRFVYEAMKKEGIALGGEESGHIIFGSLANTGDGILTSLQIARRMVQTQKSLGALGAGMLEMPQVSVSISVGNRDAVLQSPALQEAVARAREDLGERGGFLLRKSGTEPVLRVTAQGETEEKCRRAVETVAEVLRREGERV